MKYVKPLKTTDAATTDDAKPKKYIGKSLSKAQQEEIIGRVTDRIDEMSQWKKQACYYDAKRKSIDERYKRDDEMYLLFKKNIDSRWSNVASPLFFKAMQQITADFTDADIKTKCKPTLKSDTNRVKILEIVNAKWESTEHSNVKEADDVTFNRMVSHGTAVDMVEWDRIERKVHEIKKNVKSGDALSDEEFDRLMQVNELPYKEVDMTIINDLVRKPVLMSEFLVHPGVKTLQGTFKAANDCALDQWISLEDALAELNSDPLVIKSNIKLVKAEGVNETDDPMKPVKENSSKGMKGQVRRRKYYNVSNDEYIVLYNNVLLKSTYLAFHLLPFVEYKYTEFNDQFFVPGLAAFVDPLTREHEAIKNALIDEQKIRVNPPVYADSMIFDDVVDGVENLTPGKIVEVEGLSETPNAIVPHPTSGIRSTEMFQMLGFVEQEVTSIAGVNDKRSGSVQTVNSATEMSVMDQATAKVIRRVVKNYFKGRKRLTGLACRYFIQEYSKDVVMDMNGEKLKTPKRRSILLEGKAIKMPTSDKDKWKERRIEGYSEFEIQPDYLKLEGLVEFEIAPETIQKLTGNQEIQKYQNALPQLMVPGIAGDPRYAQPGQPIPMISSYKLIKKYVDALELGDIMNYEEYDEDQEIEDARDESEKILGGENVLGVPGKCLSHIQEHERYVLVVSDLLEKYAQQLEPDPMLKAISQKYKVNDLVPKQGQNDMTEKAMSEIYQRVEYLIRHIELDKMQSNQPLDLRSIINKTVPKGFHLMADGRLMSDAEMAATQPLKSVNGMPVDPNTGQPMPPDPMTDPSAGMNMMGGMDPNMASLPGGQMPMPSSGSPVATQGSVVPQPTQFANGM